MAKKKTQEDKEYARVLLGVKSILDRPEGRDFLWHVLGLCDIYSDSYGDINFMNYMAGRKSVALLILQLLEDTDKTAYARLLLEKQKESANA